MMKVRLAVVLCASVLGAAVSAQPPTTPPADPTVDMRPGEVQRLFDAYVIMQAQNALSLTEEQYAKFLPRVRALQEARRKSQQERAQIIAELQRLTNPRQPRPPDEAILKDRLNALQDTESRGAAELRKAYHAIDEVLDLRQQARFRVFEEQMERRKLELLLRARQNQRQERKPPL